MMRSHIVGTAVALAVALALTACDDHNENGMIKAPGAPTFPSAWGARVTDGQLKIWTGRRCERVRKIVVGHDLGGPDLELRPTSAGGASVEYLTLGGPYPDLEVVEDWPAGTDWRTADVLTLQVDSPAAFAGSETKVSEIVDGSASHPADTYWFQGFGWLNPAEVAARDGKDFATMCTPNQPQKGT